MRGMMLAIVFMVAAVGLPSGSSWGADDEARRARPHSIVGESMPRRERGEAFHGGVMRDNVREIVAHPTAATVIRDVAGSSVRGANAQAALNATAQTAAVMSHVPPQTLQRLGDLVSRYGNKERTGTATGAQYLQDLATTVTRYTGNGAPPTATSLEQHYQTITTVQGLVQPYVAKNGWGDIDVAHAPTRGVGEVSSVAVSAGESVPLHNLGELVSRYGNKERTGTATGAEYLRDLGTTVNRYRGTSAAPTSISVEQFIQNVTTLQGLAQPYVESNGWGDVGGKSGTATDSPRPRQP